MRATSHQVCLQHTQDLVKICQELGWLVNLEKSELEPKQIFDFVGYQFDFKAGRVRPTPDHWQNLQDKILEMLSLHVLDRFIDSHRKNCHPTGLPSPGIHVLDRFTNSYRKASSPRPTTYETHTVASQKELEGTRVSGEGDPNPKVPALPLTMLARGRQHSHRPTSTPNKTCSANFYRRIKRRVGRSLK